MKLIKLTDDTIRFIFGHEAAEDDDIERLKKYYFKNTTYERLRSSTALRILIGHKGVGKSALLTVASQEDAMQNRLSIMLRPDDIAEVLLESKDINTLIRAWKSGLLRLIRGKVVEYFSMKVDFIPDGCASNWSALARDLASNLSKWIASKGVVLDETRRSVLEAFCHDNVIRIYVDDLDRGWTATAESVVRMSAMLNAMRDIAREYKNIRFVVSMRSDVFYLVRTSDESTDKLESSCIWFSWTNHDILAMLMKRVKTFFGKYCPEDAVLVQQEQSMLASDLSLVMEDRFKGHGAWSNIPTYRMLMTLIRRRPRDLVKLCTLAARHAYENGRIKIGAEDFDAIFSRYSQDRLQDTINEFRSELPNIQELLENMKPDKRARKHSAHRNSGFYVFTTDELVAKLKNIAQGHHFKFYGKSTFATEKELISFLYKIGFITARRKQSTGKIVRHFFEEQNYIGSLYADYGYEWEVHLAYRWALSPADVDTLSEVDVLEDDKVL